MGMVIYKRKAPKNKINMMDKITAKTRRGIIFSKKWG
jgi:hypothetical protein